MALQLVLQPPASKKTSKIGAWGVFSIHRLDGL